MGCFTESCGISHLTIGYGEEAYLLPLVPSKYPDDNGSSYVQSMSLYSPLCLPIKGIYDDYGSMEKIKETVTTKMIEEYFGVSIQKFIDTVCEPISRRSLEEFKHPELMKTIRGMWIHGKVYDHYAVENQYMIDDTYRNIERHLEMVEIDKQMFPTTDTPDGWYPKPDIMREFDKTALDLYYNPLKKKEKGLVEDMSKFYSVEETMYSVNSMFIPTFSGSQDGSDEKEFEMHDFVCKILKERISE